MWPTTFPQFNRWDAALLAIAAYVAVSSLVRLMRARREQLVAQFKHEVELEHARLARPGRAPQAASGRDAA